ncbi:MAG: hypothetical protein ABS85_08280 [Sphingobacteriales bacterium SCN 48-20]|jgi:hypothetical protein|nr:MAG: hypothetical protein ABS85_08280 [Sphingobacteriales bacterium SCN 48-20]OJW44012.1 MAG: hypothetical protein BGO56_19110 [Sphingobacteriales bacterium 48-107]
MRNMKKILLAIGLFLSLQGQSQTVFGYWYGYANVKTKAAASNYLVELILQPEKGYVKGILNYYFKNTYRSLQVKGNYNNTTRQLNLYDIPVTYFGSNSQMEVDCMMNMLATLRVAQAGSVLQGSFKGQPDYQYTCPDINFTLTLNDDISVRDSVLKAIREYKETYQVWTPGEKDTVRQVTIIQRKVSNLVVEGQYKQRENIVNNEIEVDSDSLTVDFYDNGEVDGDSISVFFNSQLLAFYQRLSTKAIHFDLVLDSTKDVNEISMFADNLGSIPPNTALMIVSDGKKRHEIRMTSNLEKNAVLKIRRRVKQP